MVMSVIIFFAEDVEIEFEEMFNTIMGAVYKEEDISLLRRGSAEELKRMKKEAQSQKQLIESIIENIDLQLREKLN